MEMRRFRVSVKRKKKAANGAIIATLHNNKCDIFFPIAVICRAVALHFYIMGCVRFLQLICAEGRYTAKYASDGKVGVAGWDLNTWLMNNGNGSKLTQIKSCSIPNCFTQLCSTLNSFTSNCSTSNLTQSLKTLQLRLRTL